MFTQINIKKNILQKYALILIYKIYFCNFINVTQLTFKLILALITFKIVD